MNQERLKQKTNQQFKWTEGSIERHFLLMPGEVKEFWSLMEKGLSTEYAFERLTGKPMEGKAQIRLVIETYLN